MPMEAENPSADIKGLKALIDSVSSCGLILFRNDIVEHSNKVAEGMVVDPSSLLCFLLTILAGNRSGARIIEKEFLRRTDGLELKDEAESLGLHEVKLQVRVFDLPDGCSLFSISEDRTHFWRDHVFLSFISDTIEKGLALFEEDPSTGLSRAIYANAKYCEILGVPRKVLLELGTAAVRSRAHADDRQIADVVAGDAVVRGVQCVWPVRFLASPMGASESDLPPLGERYKWLRFGLTARKVGATGKVLLAAFLEEFGHMARLGGFDRTPDITEVDSPRRGLRLVPQFRRDDFGQRQPGSNEASSDTTTEASDTTFDVTPTNLDLSFEDCMKEESRRFVFALARDKTFFTRDISLLREELVLDLPPLFRKLFHRCMSAADAVPNVRMILQIFSQYIGADTADWLERYDDPGVQANRAAFKTDKIILYVLPFMLRMVILESLQLEQGFLLSLLRARLNDFRTVIGQNLVRMFQLQLAIILAAVNSPGISATITDDFLQETLLLGVEADEYVFIRAMKLHLWQAYARIFPEDSFTQSIGAQITIQVSQLLAKYPNVNVFANLFRGP